MPKIAFPPHEALYPEPCVLVTSHDPVLKIDNIITIAWCGVASSKPPILNISIRPSRLSHSIIKSTREFVVNIPMRNLLKEVDQCGSISGRKADKFQLCNFHKEKALNVAAPLIKECPVNIECRLKEVIALGSHDMFLGEVAAVHVDEGVLKDGKDIDYKKAPPIVYNLGEYWGLGEALGSYGYSRKL